MKPTPWERRLDESPEHYRQFLWWRDQSPRPPPSDPVLARCYDWSTRAAAWDALRDLPEDPAERARETVENMITMLDLASRKLLLREVSSPEATVEIKELGRAIKNLAVIAATIAPTRSTTVDQQYKAIVEHNWTAEELRVIVKASETFTK